MCANFVWAFAVASVLVAQEPPQIASSPSEPPKSDSISVDSSGYPDFPPLPKGAVSLIGGTVVRVDPIRDRMTVRAFGGRDVVIDFDVRTRVLNGASPAAMRDVQPGTRIYADTILNDRRIFAKNVRIETRTMLGETRGQVISYDPDRRVVRVRDIVSSQPLTFRLSSQTDIRAGSQPSQLNTLSEGTLVQIMFHSVADGPSTAEKIEILAQPGSIYTFSGRIAVIDLRDRHLTLYPSGGEGENTFEVGLNSLPERERAQLKQGLDVIVHARYDGHRYEAQSIEPTTTVPKP